MRPSKGAMHRALVKTQCFTSKQDIATHRPMKNRKTIRLKGYDYSSVGRYFVTIVNRNRLHLFGNIVNGHMQLNAFGEIAAQEWENTLNLRNNVSLGAFMIMPDHIHFVIHIEVATPKKDYEPDELERRSGAVRGKDIIKPQSLSTIVRGYKAAITNRLKTMIYEYNDALEKTKNPVMDALKPLIRRIDLNKSIWVRNYHEIIIRDARAYNNISRYINNNPKKWEENLQAKCRALAG